MPKKIIKGVVVSSCNDKTIIVRVEKRVEHPLYSKIIRTSKKYAAHDPENKYKVGDMAVIIESRPLSKTKKWHVVY